MISMWFLYWLNVMFSFADVIALPIIVNIVLIILGIIGKCVDDDVGKKFANYLKSSIITLCVCILISVLIPSKKEAIAIYMIPKVVNNEQVMQLPENAVKYLNVLFKKEIEEIQNGVVK